jgi:hypothetical protein
VRTLCDDSTYSDWVYGPKFTMNCPHDSPTKAPKMIISPNPATEKVTIQSNGLKKQAKFS